MKNKSVVPFVAVAAALIAGAGYWTFTRFPTMPLAASAQAAHVDSAWNGLLIVETAVYALVMAFILYCLLVFRAAKRS